MKLLKIPEGNGQEIYIDPDWIKATDEQYGYFYISDDVETPGRKDRKEVLSYLLDLGYNVITDSSKAKEDTFFLLHVVISTLMKLLMNMTKRKQRKFIIV